MNNKADIYYIQNCLLEIETRLNWGDSGQWTNYDFEKLSADIQDATGVSLSVSTLKRLWGKVNYQNIPALNTLNTLARFAGYEDWRVFKRSGRHAAVEEGARHKVQGTGNMPEISSQTITAPSTKRSYRYWLLATIPLVVAVYFLVVGLQKGSAIAAEPAVPDPAQFSFKADKMVTVGLPNSVVFTYDATAAQTDSVYIVQTWDISRKTWVPKNSRQHSAIYYYPGFFRTRLIVDKTIVKAHDLLIGTDGWLVLHENDPVPLYFKKEEYLKGDRIEIDKATLQSYNLSLFPQAPKIRFFNMKDLGTLMNDNYIFETTLKNDFREGSGACQFVQVLIQCKNDIIIIPLSAKSCIGDIKLTACGKALTSKDADLSKFGCDLTQWTRLKVETVNRHMSFYVNDTLAASFFFPNDPTGIVGVQYRFQGPGAVKDTRFTSEGREYHF